ncbi:helix-turn-helix transcriptional regulator [Xenophilus aerolatus]
MTITTQSNLTPQEGRWLRKKHVLSKIPVSKSTLDNWLNSKSRYYKADFPQPIYLEGGRIPYWSALEVEEWLAAHDRHGSAAPLPQQPDAAVKSRSGKPHNALAQSPRGAAAAQADIPSLSLAGAATSPPPPPPALPPAAQAAAEPVVVAPAAYPQCSGRKLVEMTVQDTYGKPRCVFVEVRRKRRWLEALPPATPQAISQQVHCEHTWSPAQVKGGNAQSAGGFVDDPAAFPSPRAGAD